MERATGSLVPYVYEWDLSLNPEDLAAMVGTIFDILNQENPIYPDDVSTNQQQRIEEFTIWLSAQTAI